MATSTETTYPHIPFLEATMTLATAEDEWQLQFEIVSCFCLGQEIQSLMVPEMRQDLYWMAACGLGMTLSWCDYDKLEY